MSLRSQSAAKSSAGFCGAIQGAFIATLFLQRYFCNALIGEVLPVGCPDEAGGVAAVVVSWGIHFRAAAFQRSAAYSFAWRCGLSQSPRGLVDGSAVPTPPSPSRAL